MTTKSKPLVYSCSGCSNVAQLANDLAVAMDRQGDAEMSCIAGVGGDVKSLVKLAKSGRDICAIDGCALACVKHTLARHQVTAKWHFELTQFDVKKRKFEDCSAVEYDKVKAQLYRELNIIARS